MIARWMRISAAVGLWACGSLSAAGEESALAKSKASVFGARPVPALELPNMETGVLPAGTTPCGWLSAPDPRVFPVEGDWLALAERGGNWTLEPASVSRREADVLSTVPGSRFLIRRLPQLKPGPVKAATLTRGSGEDVAVFGGRTWRLHGVGDRVALDSGDSRWWLMPGGPWSEPPGRPECVNRPGPCSDDEIALHYRIKWSGDLDGDAEPDFLFEWSRTEAVGITLGLSGSAPEGAKLKLVAAYWDGCS
jgi:hypothetical protein